MWTVLWRRQRVLGIATFLLLLTMGGIGFASAPSGDPTPKLPANAAEIAALAQERGQPVFLFFQTFGCGFCETMEPIVNSLEEQLSGEILFLYVDVYQREGWELDRALNVRFYPSYLLYDTDGKRIGQWFGPLSEADLKAYIEHALGKS